MRTRRRERLTLVATALLLAAVGCRGASDDASPSESSTVATTSTTSPTATSTPATTATTNTAAKPPTPIPSGPSFDRDFPDPFVLWTGAQYHAMSTTSALIQLPHLDAADLAHWAGPSELLAETPPWADPLSTWAPSLLVLGRRHVLFFAAQVRGSDQHCIGVATAGDPDGPYTMTSPEPLLCPRSAGGAIDPSPFADGDGSLWLLWKNDGITLRQQSAIWSQRLSPDGTHLVGDAVRLIGTDQPWEYPHVEAPSMMHVGGAYWLAYSGNWWNDEAYGVGLARCETPTGPCEKPFDHAVLTSRANANGPGGGEFFTDSTGRVLFAYHAWLGTPGYPGHRALFVSRVEVVDGLIRIAG
jgi:beta-xylosidase